MHSCKRQRFTTVDNAAACAQKCETSSAERCLTQFTELGRGTESKYVYSTERLTWDEADRACKAAGMRLATIRDEQEQMEVRRRLLPHAISLASNFIEPIKKHNYMLMSNAWIGLRAEAGGEFHWPDRAADAKASENKYGWGRFQPNESSRQPRCGMMIRGMWNDRKCDVKSGYVCEQAAVCDVIECDPRLVEDANVLISDPSHFFDVPTVVAPPPAVVAPPPAVVAISSPPADANVREKEIDDVLDDLRSLLRTLAR